MMDDRQFVQRCDFRMHDVIDGKYRVERVLGTSQTEEIFKVVDPMGKEYVLKLMRLWDVAPRLRQKMIASSDSEIKSCSIKSCYLTHIVGSGKVYGNPYLLIDYFQATDLSRHIGNHRMNLIKIAKEILFGLRDLHKSGKVHGHLSPENILIADDDRIMLTNYVTLGIRGGASTSSKSLSNLRFVDKSLAYQAPELYHAERTATILPSADIFSFGVVMFQLLTGTLPFGKFVTDVDRLNYQSQVRSNCWNRNLLLRNDSREMWMSLFDSCFAVESEGRAKNVDEVLNLLPEDDTVYHSESGNNIEVSAKQENGILLRVMQGDDFGKIYRLNELMQLPRRVVTLGRKDNDVFNMIALPERVSTISRKHCTFEWDDDSDVWFVRDGQWDKNSKSGWRSSLNGTFINSEQVTEEGHPMVIGDIISLGDIKLRVEGY